MNCLLAIVLFLSHRAEPLQAIDFGLGVGFIAHKTNWEGLGDEVFAGGGVEVAYAQKYDAVWSEIGASGLFGAGIGMTSGLIDEYIQCFGMHLDAGYSLVKSSYVDLKLGIGAGGKYLRRERQSNAMDRSHNLYLVSRKERAEFQVCARGMAALNLHMRNGIGGVEIRPIKMELGPSFFDFTPSASVYWAI